jgi:hypothetical protein
MDVLDEKSPLGQINPVDGAQRSAFDHLGAPLIQPFVKLQATGAQK